MYVCAHPLKEHRYEQKMKKGEGKKESKNGNSREKYGYL